MAQTLVEVPADARAGVRRVAAAAMVLGGAAVVLGTLMPWAKVNLPLLGTQTTTGLGSGGDAVFCIVVGAGACLVGLRTLFSGGPTAQAATERAAVALVGVLGIVAVIFAGFAAKHVDDRLSSLFGHLPDFAKTFVSGEIGTGIWIVGAGAVVVTLASLAQVVASAPQRG